MRFKQVHQRGNSIDGKLQFVYPFFWIIHGGRRIQQQMAPEISLLLKLLYKKLIGAGQKLPVDLKLDDARLERVSAFLSKPVSSGELQTCFESLLGGHGLR